MKIEESQIDELMDSVPEEFRSEIDRQSLISKATQLSGANIESTSIFYGHDSGFAIRSYSKEGADEISSITVRVGLINGKFEVTGITF